MQRFGSVLALVLLAVTLGAPLGGGGGGGGGVDAFPLFPNLASSRVGHGYVDSGPFVGSMFGAVVSAASATMGRHFILLSLWPGDAPPLTAVLAASHLRLDPATGLIEEVPECERSGSMKFHTPVQHPGGPPPNR